MAVSNVFPKVVHPGDGDWVAFGGVNSDQPIRLVVEEWEGELGSSTAGWGGKLW